jgi:YVTN family beta-propeller protein
VIDADRLEARSKVAVCDEPTELAILPDASKVFVACSGSGQVAVVALASPEPSDQKNAAAPAATRSSKNGKRHVPDARSAPENSDHLLALLDVGKTPLHLALKPDGGEIFVSNFDSNTVSEIITNTNEVNGSYLIGKNPVRGLISADNSTLYVTNFGSDSVGVYSIDDGKLVATVHVGSRPDAMALSPNQNFLFVVETAAGDVAVVRAAELPLPVLLTMIPVGQQPNAIAVKAFILRKPPQP